MSMIAIGVMAAASALKGLSAASSQSAQNQSLLANANYRASVLRYNADRQFETSMFNSALIGSQAITDATTQTMGAALSIKQLKEAANFNISLQKESTTLQLAALADQLPQLLAQHDLSTEYLRQQTARSQGTIIAQQGASGVLISSQSSQQVITDLQSQAALEQSVLDYNLHIQQKSVFDAMAKSQWEGQMAIDAIAFEANQSLSRIKNETTFNAYSILQSAFNKQQATLFDSYQQHQSAYFDASSLLDSTYASLTSPTEKGLYAGVGQAASFAASYFGGK